MKLRPLQDRLVVRRLEGETTSKGGIIIPDSAKERPLEGEVIAVGAGKRKLATESYSASTPALKFRSRASNTSSFARTKSSVSSPKTQ